MIARGLLFIGASYRRLGFAMIVAAALGVAMPAAYAAVNDDQQDEYVRPKAPQKPRYALNDIDFDHQKPVPPMSIEELENIQPEHSYPLKDTKLGKLNGMPADIRNDAMKQAALSYGARGGLAWRTYEIRTVMDKRASYMNKVFDFRSLLIPAPSGLLIEPPVISEQDDALLINSGGADAAVSDRVYEISKNARIVSTPRHWRNYLEREWGEISPPPDLLRPQNPDERKRWVDWIIEGWRKGVEQADEIFEDDLNQLTSDYQGMVRYRLLLAQGMVSPPYAMQTDRGVTGDGKTLRVGDRQVEITGMPALNSGSRTWTPANR